MTWPLAIGASVTHQRFSGRVVHTASGNTSITVDAPRHSYTVPNTELIDTPSDYALVFPVLGQSNAEGFGVTSYAPASLTDCWLYTHASTVVALEDPTSEGAGEVGGYGHDPPYFYSAWPRFAERLRALGVTRTIVIVPCAWSGSTSAQWASSLVEPPNDATLLGRTKNRIHGALAAFPGAKIGGVITYQGESDGGSLAVAQAHDNNWISIYDSLDAFIALRAAFEKTCRHWHVKISPTPATGLPNWADVRTAQALLASSTTRIVDAPETVPAGELHHDTGASDATGYRRIGVDLADDWMAAT